MYMLLTNSHQWHLYCVNYMALTPSKQEPGLQKIHLNCKLLINLTPTRLRPDSNLTLTCMSPLCHKLEPIETGATWSPLQLAGFISMSRESPYYHQGIIPSVAIIMY